MSNFIVKLAEDIAAVENTNVPVISSFNHLYVNRRDDRSMSLVHPTDRDLLTALGQNTIDLHQTRVPGLEFGTG